jgi:hypothetical protein
MIKWLERWAESLKKKSVEVLLAGVEKHLECAVNDICKIGLQRNDSDMMQVELRRRLRYAQWGLMAYRRALYAPREEEVSNEVQAG